MIDILYILYSLCDYVIVALSILLTIVAIIVAIATSTPIDSEDTYKYRNF